MWFLLACAPNASSPVARPPLEVTSTRAEVLPIEPINPVLLPRRPALKTKQRASSWTAAVPDCVGCLPIEVRAQASTELAEGNELRVASLATDGDTRTAWCGAEGLGDQLSLGRGEPFDVARLHIAGWTGSGTAVTEVLVVTDRGDRFVVELPAPGRHRWPAPGVHPPVLDVALTGVRFVQLEIRSLSGPGRGCISEVLLEGTP